MSNSVLPYYRTQCPAVAERFTKIRQRPVILSVRNLRKSFIADGTERTVFDGVSLDIHRREFITVIGPSGCGKSTFIRIVAGWMGSQSPAPVLTAAWSSKAIHFFHG